MLFRSGSHRLVSDRLAEQPRSSLAPDNAASFRPIFLLNDILRFWRTLTLNYEHDRLKLRRVPQGGLQKRKAGGRPAVVQRRLLCPPGSAAVGPRRAPRLAHGPAARGSRGSLGSYGGRRVYAELVLGRGVQVGYNTVALLLRRAGLTDRTGAPKRAGGRGVCRMPPPPAIWCSGSSHERHRTSCGSQTSRSARRARARSTAPSRTHSNSSPRETLAWERPPKPSTTTYSLAASRPAASGILPRLDLRGHVRAMVLAYDVGSSKPDTEVGARSGLDRGSDRRLAGRFPIDVWLLFRRLVVAYVAR